MQTRSETEALEKLAATWQSRSEETYDLARNAVLAQSAWQEVAYGYALIARALLWAAIAAKVG